MFKLVGYLEQWTNIYVAPGATEAVQYYFPPDSAFRGREKGVVVIQLAKETGSGGRGRLVLLIAPEEVELGALVLHDHLRRELTGPLDALVNKGDGQAETSIRDYCETLVRYLPAPGVSHLRAADRAEKASRRARRGAWFTWITSLLAVLAFAGSLWMSSELERTTRSVGGLRAKVQELSIEVTNTTNEAKRIGGSVPAEAGKSLTLGDVNKVLGSTESEVKNAYDAFLKKKKDLDEQLASLAGEIAKLRGEEGKSKPDEVSLVGLSQEIRMLRGEDGKAKGDDISAAGLLQRIKELRAEVDGKLTELTKQTLELSSKLPWNGILGAEVAVFGGGDDGSYCKVPAQTGRIAVVADPDSGSIKRVEISRLGVNGPLIGSAAPGEKATFVTLIVSPEATTRLPKTAALDVQFDDTLGVKKKCVYLLYFAK